MEFTLALVYHTLERIARKIQSFFTITVFTFRKNGDKAYDILMQKLVGNI